MCFSSEASFGAGAILLLAGGVALKMAKKPSQWAFAGIPLIFGIQQISEGFVWIALTDPGHVSWRQPATYIFLFFAQILWPAWVPFSILQMEKEKKRRRLLYVTLLIGLAVSVSLAYRMLTQNILAEVEGSHVSYGFGVSPGLVNFFGTLYVLSTILPPFVSSVRKMWIVGFGNLLSFFVSLVFYDNHVISVWCFFAALVSVGIIYIIGDLRGPYLRLSGLDT